MISVPLLGGAMLLQGALFALILCKQHAKFTADREASNERMWERAAVMQELYQQERADLYARIQAGSLADYQRHSEQAPPGGANPMRGMFSDPDVIE